MNNLLTHHYTHALWALFLANAAARGTEVTQSLQGQLREFWQANEQAQVAEKDIPAAVLTNLYELAHADDADALQAVSSTL